MNRALAFITEEPWFITENWLETIVSIAKRENDSPEAVSVKLGKSLQNTQTVTVRDGFAIVPIKGPIFRYANLFTDISGATSTEVFARDLRIAEEEPEADQIILKIDSPGGQAPGIAEAATLIKNARKPVIAYVDGMAASAAYWLAAAANKVVVSRTAEVGSIGTVFIARIDKSDNRVTIVSRQSPKKRLNPGTEEGNKQLQERADAFSEVFINDIAQFRDVTVEKVLSDFGQGGLLLGQAAVDAGMADRVGTFEEIIEGVEFMAREEITIASLRADHPDVCEAIEKEARDAAYNQGLAKGREEGRAAEVERIKSVRDQSIPGHEALIEKMMFDGVSTGADAALEIVKAEKVARTTSHKQFKEEAPPVLNDAREPENKKKVASDDLPLDEQAKYNWDNDPELRADFIDFDGYKAYFMNEGNVQVLGGKVQ